MTTIARPFVFAWHFLTAIPLSRTHHEPTAPELAASMAWYPIVGVLIGSGLIVADMALSAVFAPEVGNALLILILVFLTRGLHQDGLADTLDGLAGGHTPTERLAIMRDPRIGALGATGLMLSLILRYAGLLALPHAIRIPALLCMPAVGRWAMVVLAWASPYARTDGGLAAPFLANLSRAHVLIATGLLTAVMSLAFGIPMGLTVLVVGAAIIVMLWASYRSWFGGITGDTLGATNEVVEILFLLLIPLLLVWS
jgi:adenosylcobinamide-GDP ribazoletransferase